METSECCEQCLVTSVVSDMAKHVAYTCLLNEYKKVTPPTSLNLVIYCDEATENNRTIPQHLSQKAAAPGEVKFEI